MVNIQALKLVPGRNWCAEAKARATASLTRSSAWSLLDESERAKARRCGRCSTTAALTSVNCCSTLEAFVVGLISAESSDKESIRRELPIRSIARPLEVGPTEVRRVDIMRAGEFPHAVLLSGALMSAAPSSVGVMPT